VARRRHAWPSADRWQVLDRFLSGKAPKRIARELRLSPWTVREHDQRLYKHYAVSSREELMARFVRA
jgi:DNA-binding CsgD family transcriptional regulator